MNNWKYILFMANGKRQVILQRIKDRVKTAGLSHAIPMVKFERSRSTQFYLGLALDIETESETDWPQQEIMDCINSMNIGHMIKENNNQILFESTGNNNFNRFLSGRVEAESFTSKITFEKGDPLESDDEFTECPTREKEIDNIQHFNQLYWWCSAKREGSYNLFKQSCSELGFNQDKGLSPWTLYRRLLLLGHLEKLDDNLNWQIVPTSFRRVLGSERFYLLGRYTPWLGTQLLQDGTYKITSSNSGPDRVEIDETMLSFIDSSQIAVDTDIEKLIEESEAIDIRKSSLYPDPDVDNIGYEIHRYINGQNVKLSNFDNRPGLYWVKRLGELDIKGYRFYDGEKWFKGAYYDLRFIHYQQHEVGLKVKHLEDDRLLVDAEKRWPYDFEKLLVQASGKLPLVLENNEGRALCYENIPLELVSTLCESLNISLIKG